MDRETELALIRRLRDGDTTAFDLVYDEFSGRLYSFLARLSGRREVADDLLEETWLRLVANAKRLRPDTRLGPWLFTVARNLHVSYCRSRLIGEAYAPDLVNLWPATPAPPSPFEEAAASELGGRVERAMSRLPPRYREVLLLVIVGEFTPAEAATVCGVTPAVMRQRLWRARATLVRELGATGGRQAPVLRKVMT